MAQPLAECIMHVGADRRDLVSVDARPVRERLDGRYGHIEIARIRGQQQADLVRHALTLAHNVGRILVIPQSEIRRVAQDAFTCPLAELDLGHQLRLYVVGQPSDRARWRRLER